MVRFSDNYTAIRPLPNSLCGDLTSVARFTARRTGPSPGDPPANVSPIRTTPRWRGLAYFTTPDCRKNRLAVWGALPWPASFGRGSRRKRVLRESLLHGLERVEVGWNLRAEADPRISHRRQNKNISQQKCFGWRGLARCRTIQRMSYFNKIFSAGHFIGGRNETTPSHFEPARFISQRLQFKGRSRVSRPPNLPCVQP